MRSYPVRAAFALAIVYALPTVVVAAQPFNARAFQKSQAAVRTTLIHVGAAWCAACRKQQPIIEQIEQELPDLVVYDVDFDSAKDIVQRLGVRYPTTLIVFKGRKEIARSVGDTSTSGIRALVAAGL